MHTGYNITRNVYMNLAYNVSFFNCKFKNSESEVDADASLIKGDFLHVTSTSKVFIKNSSFINGVAKIGGAIYMLGDTDVMISSSQFTFNSAQYGGAISGVTIGSLTITEGSSFIANQAIYGQGDAIHLANLQSAFVLNDTKFYNGTPSNFIYINSGAMLNMSRVEFSALKSTFPFITSKYGGVLLIDVLKLHIQASKFINLFGTGNGGAIFMSELES